MCAGLILFALVAHLVLLPKASASGNLASIAPMLLAASLASCVVAIFLSTRVAPPVSGQSADFFWTTAASPGRWLIDYAETASTLRPAPPLSEVKQLLMKIPGR